MAHIRIYLQLREYPSCDDIERAVTIDDLWLRELLEKIDHPSHDADPIIRTFICTPAHRITKLTGDRKRAAKTISEHVELMVLEALEQFDTEMGYKKAG